LRNRIIIVTVLLAFGFIVIFALMRNAEGKKLEYETEKVEKGDITAIVSATGSLSPVTTVDVGSQVSGTIQEVLVDYNDHVKAGQILARIDPSLYEAQLAQSKARLESARSALESAEADLDRAKTQVAQAHAQVLQAQAGLEQARADVLASRSQLASACAALEKAKVQEQFDHDQYKRAEQLFKENLISQSEKEQAYTTWQVSKSSYESARAGVRAAQAAVAAAQSRVKSSESNLRAVQAQEDSAIAAERSQAAKIVASRAAIRQAEGDVASVEVNLDRCIIRSPIDGIVVDRKVQPGQTVAASFQTPVLFQLARNLEMMEVKAAVDEADIGRVRQGQLVTFTVDAFPEERFNGKVYQVRSSPQTSQNVVTYDVIIRTQNPGMRLKPGMTANIEIRAEEKKGVLRIPNTALRFRPERIKNFPLPEDVKKEMEEKKKMEGKDGKEGGQVTVWVLKDGHPQRRKIKPGISDNIWTEVVSGDLREGELVITDASTVKKKGQEGPSPTSGERRFRIRI
jgi:HlyD family secretion protein